MAQPLRFLTEAPRYRLVEPFMPPLKA